jgi:hypothetical protein
MPMLQDALHDERGLQDYSLEQMHTDRFGRTRTRLNGRGLRLRASSTALRTAGTVYERKVRHELSSVATIKHVNEQQPMQQPMRWPHQRTLASRATLAGMPSLTPNLFVDAVYGGVLTHMNDTIFAGERGSTKTGLAQQRQLPASPVQKTLPISECHRSAA